MEQNDEFDLILNYIGTEERIRSKNDADFDEYQQMARLYLSKKGRGLFEDDILQSYRKGASLKEIFSCTYQYVPGPSKEKNGRREQIWYDILGIDEVDAESSFYDYFFAVKLSHLDIFQIDDFLAYHLQKSFNNDLEQYHKFLLLALRKHKKRFRPEQLETIDEWIETSKPAQQLAGGEEKTKGRIKRGANDNLTVLNQRQTALFIHFLQQSRIILKDEYLNNTEAGQAFAVLTGYSADSLRQELGADKLSKAAKKDLEKLYNILIKLEKLIDSRIKESKPS